MHQTNLAGGARVLSRLGPDGTDFDTQDAHVASAYTWHLGIALSLSLGVSIHRLRRSRPRWRRSSDPIIW